MRWIKQAHGSLNPKISSAMGIRLISLAEDLGMQQSQRSEFVEAN